MRQINFALIFVIWCRFSLGVQCLGEGTVGFQCAAGGAGEG